YQVVLAPGRGAGGKARHAFFPKSGGPSEEELTAHYVATATEAGYVIEALLPWSNLRGLDATEGAAVAVQAYVNNHREDGRPAMRVGLHPALDTSSDASKKVAFVLAGEGGGESVRARATAGVDEAGRPVVRVYGVPELAGKPVVLRSVERVVGGGDGGGGGGRGGVGGGEEAGRPVVRVYGVPELAGKPVVLRSGERVLGEGGFAATDGRRAWAEIAVAAAPEGRAWRVAEAV